jgi:hypothetical protein
MSNAILFTRRNLARAALSAITVAAGVLSLAGRAPAEEPKLGTGTIAPYRVVPSLDALPQAREGQGGALKEQVIPLRTPVDPETFKALKEDAAKPKDVR